MCREIRAYGPFAVGSIAWLGLSVVLIELLQNIWTVIIFLRTSRIAWIDVTCVAIATVFQKGLSNCMIVVVGFEIRVSLRELSGKNGVVSRELISVVFLRKRNF